MSKNLYIGIVASTNKGILNVLSGLYVARTEEEALGKLHRDFTKNNSGAIQAMNVIKQEKYDLLDTLSQLEFSEAEISCLKD